MIHALSSSGAVRKLHIHPLRSVTSGKSVRLRCHNDDWYQRLDPAQFPAGAPAYPAGGEAGASAQQCTCSVQVRHEPEGSAHHHTLFQNIAISDYTCICACCNLLLPQCLTSLSWFSEYRKSVERYDPSALYTDSEYFRESIRHEIRMARERFSGQALSKELSRIQKRLDSVELLTPDIVMNLLLSYRDIQVCLCVCFLHLFACECIIGVRLQLLIIYFIN